MTKPRIITNDDLIKALPQERQDKINAEVEKNVAKWVCRLGIPAQQKLL